DGMGRFSRAGRVLVAATLLMIALAGALPARPARAAKAPWCPPQTGVCSEGAFLDFWGNVDAATGGYALDIIGLPISPTLQTPGGLIVQFYERNRFEAHPENSNPRYQVLLGRLGAEFLAALGGQVRTWPTVKTPSYGDGGAAPQPLPTPTSSDQQLVATAYSLISSVPEKR